MRIIAAFEETGYVPNMLARSLVSRRNEVIAALVPAVADSSFLESVQALDIGLRRRGLRLLVGHGGGAPEFEAGVVDMLLGHRPQAFVLTGVTHDPRLVRILKSQSIRTVEIWNITRKPIDLNVGFSNRAAAKALTEAMLSAGRERIAFIGLPGHLSDRARDRLLGYRAALSGAGARIREALIIEAETGFAGGAGAIETLIGGAEPFDAVIVTGEQLAAGALLAGLTHHLAIPDRVAFGTFGRLPPGLQRELGVILCEIDGAGIGEAVAECLGQMLVQHKEPSRRVVDVGFRISVAG